MDNFMQAPVKITSEQNQKERITFNPHITSERIEKLKKTFQPFWMRGVILHNPEDEETLNAKKVLNQI